MTSNLKIIEVQIQGTTDLLLHSSAGMNPKNQVNKTIEPIKNRRGKAKTEYVLASMEKADWLNSGVWATEGRCYLQGEDFVFEGYSNPAVPTEYLIRSIQEAAKASKMGKQVSQSVTQVDDELIILDYKGTKDASEMWEDPYGRFVDCRSVRIGTSKIMRNRVRIPSGYVGAASLLIDTSLIDVDSVKNFIVDAGRRIGIGDFRVKFGKFKVLQFNMLGFYDIAA